MSRDCACILLRAGAVASALALAACGGGQPGDAAVAAVDAPPVVAFDVPDRADSTPSVAAAGRLVAVAWGASEKGAADVYVAVSDDAGRTFGDPVRVNDVPGEARLGGELPPRVALRASRDGAPPEVAVLWTARGEATEIKAARSRDSGRRFDAPVTLQVTGAEGDRGWPSLALDAGGRAHAVWLDHRGLAARRAAQANGAGHAHASHGSMDGAAMAQASALMYASFGAEASSPAESAITSGVCYCCKTALAVGPDGALYAAWRHVYPGNLRDIAVAVSRDGGRSFTGPTRVSEDRWMINGCPDDGPSLAVDANGTLHVVWQTVTQEAGAEPEGALFYAASRDGERFTARQRVPTFGTPKPSHPQVVALADGALVVAWDEVVDGRSVAAARKVTPGPDGSVTFGDLLTMPSSAPARTPALAVTDAGVFAVWVSGTEPPRVEAATLRVP